jgi:hypothetical protein
MENTPENATTENPELDYELVPLPAPEPENASKTGPRPKKLKAVEVMGYEVGRGLRRKVVVSEDVYKLAALGLDNRAIANWFDINEDTLVYNFQQIITKGREELKMTLRQAMLKNALQGNAAVQIFLAKNLLGMSDTPYNNEDQQPLPWTD